MNQPQWRVMGGWVDEYVADARGNGCKILKSKLKTQNPSSLFPTLGEQTAVSGSVANSPS